MNAIAFNSFIFYIMLEQLKIITSPTHACALTGHRALGKDFSKEKLNTILKELIVDRNVDIFYCGMALGFDMLACELLFKLQKTYPQVKVIACIPCPEQPSMFPEKEKERYYSLLKKCYSNVLISLNYTRSCMHQRNYYMVDNADYLVAYCNKPTGGSANTVKYAQKKGIDVIFV